LFIINPVVHDRLRIDVREIYDVSRETESEGCFDWMVIFKIA